MFFLDQERKQQRPRGLNVYGMDGGGEKSIVISFFWKNNESS